MMCRWLLVAACVDRTLICSSSFSLRRFSNRRFAKIISIAIMIVCAILPVHTLIFLRIFTTPIVSCFFGEPSFALFHGIYTFVSAGFIPLIIISFCVIVIRRNLRERTARRNLMMHVDQRRNHSDHYQIIMILFIQVMIFIVSSLPFIFYTLYMSITVENIRKSTDQLMIEQLVQMITESCLYIFPALPFYSSTLASRSFRSILMKLLLDLFYRRIYRRNRTAPSNISVQVTFQTNHRLIVCRAIA